MSVRSLRPLAVTVLVGLIIFAGIATTSNQKSSLVALDFEAFDKPAEAQEFYRLKRAPNGKGPIPLERYITALKQMKQMPLYSTSLKRFLPPEKKVSSNPPTVLGTWTFLGPSNIGGRTRALLIDPMNTDTMYAAAVAGGIWKTTDGGSSWVALNDMMANLAVCSLVMDPNNSNVLYAGTGEGYFYFNGGDWVRGNGIFKSTDSGATWEQLADTANSSFFFVNDIVVSKGNSQRIYAGTRAGIWRSTNGGTNWTQVHDPGQNGGCLDLAIRTDNLAQDVVLASFGSGEQATVYRNLDAGGTGIWSPVLSDPGMARTSLAIAPSDQQTMYALAASFTNGTFEEGLQGVFRSTDGGGTWTARVRNTSSVKLNTVLLSNPHEAYLTECGILTSVFINQGWYDNIIAVDPLDANRVWVGGIDTFRSDDGGANFGIASHWKASTTLPRYVHADQHAIVFDPGFNGTTNKIMYLGNDGGLFKTTDARAAVGGAGSDNGATSVCSQITNVPWTNLNNGYGVTQFYDGVVYPDGQNYFGGTQDNGTVRGTSAGDKKWSSILGGDGGYVAVDPTNTNVLYAENYKLSIQKSTDGGAHFANATDGISGTPDSFLFITPFIMDTNIPQQLWIGGQYIWRTQNSAGSWSRASTAVTAGLVSAIAVSPTSSDLVLAGTNQGYIHRTNVGTIADATTVWASVLPSGRTSGYVSGLAYDPVDSNIAYATYSSFNSSTTEHHIYRSTNRGATWAGIDGSGSTGIPDIPVHCIVVDPNNTSKLYVGTDLGVFVSLDGGENWAVENTGFANVVTESLVINSAGGINTLFAFTHGRGAWKVVTSTLNANVFFDGSGDPRFFNASFGEPLVDSQGNIIVLSVHFGLGCPFNLCGIQLHSISPNGSLNWNAPSGGLLPADDFASNKLFFDPNNRTYIQGGRNTIYAFNSDGTQPTGWPVVPAPFDGNWTMIGSPLVVDRVDGTVYASAGVFSGNTFPSTIVALNADGSERWRNNYPGGAHRTIIAQGPQREIYLTFGFNTFRRLDHNTGTQLCETQTSTFFSGLVAGPDAVFTVLATPPFTTYPTILSFDGTCNAQAIVNLPGHDIALLGYDQGRAFAVDSQFFAVSKDGTFLWRNSEILPGSIHAIRNGVLYIIGQHITDGNKQKLFLVDAGSGQILSAIETTPYCQRCGVAVSGEGIIYLNDLASTRIYRLNTTDCLASIAPESKLFGATGGGDSITVSVPFGCSWAVGTSANWISITSGSSGYGNGTVSYEVRENFGGGERIGTIIVGGSTFTITQLGDTPCTYNINPTYAALSSNGGSGSISVSTDPTCPWNARSNSAWIKITTGREGTGNGIVIYTVLANNSGQGRKGTINIEGKSFAIKQN